CPADLFGGSAGGEQRLVFYRVLGLVILDDCPLPDVSLAVSLANFAGPWNLMAVLSVGQMTRQALFRVA
ncbi:MAG TPA: hypothetical protein VMC83_09935, partial [Streptosporangiaceae bacterium]|nr:hypothetical protein [Streptosporangiaceae bacterium]